MEEVGHSELAGMGDLAVADVAAGENAQDVLSQVKAHKPG